MCLETEKTKELIKRLLNYIYANVFKLVFKKTLFLGKIQMVKVTSNNQTEI